MGNPFHYYILDMELCQFNLDEYIHGERSTLLEALGPLSWEFVVVDRSDKFLLPQIENIWTIALHVADGLAFIHGFGQVHRDLKPRNSTFSDINLGLLL